MVSASVFVDSPMGCRSVCRPSSGDAQPGRHVELALHSSFKGVPGIDAYSGLPGKTPGKTMIWGDSHAEHFAPIIDAINTDPERSFVVFSGRRAVLGGDFRSRSPMVPSTGAVQSVALGRHEDSEGGTCCYSGDSDLQLARIRPNGSAKETPRGSRHARELTSMIREASSPGREFVLTGTVPEIPRTVVECAHTGSSKLWREPCRTVVRPSDAAAS